MKFAAVLGIVLALIGLSQARNDPRCDDPPAVIGDCRAGYLMWTFYPKKNVCKKFIFGGCDDNSNNRFDHKKDCEAACVR